MTSDTELPDSSKPPPLPSDPAGRKPSAGLPRDGTPWGLRQTVGFFFLIGCVWVVAQGIAGSLYVLATRGIEGVATLDLEKLARSGDFFATCTIATAPVAWILTAAVVWMRGRSSGIALSDYLGLKRVSYDHVLGCVAGTLAGALCIEVVSRVFDISLMPESMLEAFRSTTWRPLMWMALIVAAPLGEEVLFRGFLLPGLCDSRLGPQGAILFSASAFAAVHTQYDFFGMCVIFFVGAGLAFARLKTGSLFASILMHSLLNLISTLQLEWYLRR